MNKNFLRTPDNITLNAGYYPLLFLLSLIWGTYYSPGTDSISMVSFICQQSAVFSFIQIADSLIHGKKNRYTLAGISAVYIFLLHFNALLLSITSMTLYESVAILASGGDFLYTLEEAGLPAVFIPLLAVLLLLISASGVALYRYMPHRVIKNKAAGFVLPVIFVLSLTFFIMEQNINRNSENFFSRRLLPLYIEIFSSNSDTVTFSLSGDRRPCIEDYRNITKAENPKNVLFILLESFRADAVSSSLSPVTARLAQDSPYFTNYYTGAIYTSLAWNTILMDRPAYTFPADIEYDMEHRAGSGIFRIFKNAGYTTYAAFSANMEWKSFHERTDGKDKLIENYYCGYQSRGEGRNIIDHRTCSKSAGWIKASPPDKPFFMMIQLDSTHWTYYADKENELSSPFAGKDVNIAKLRKQQDIDLLFNRYKNSVRQVNTGINEIITALKDSGRYNDTAVIIVSDHGEGFAPGMIGHSVMHDNIKKPAFILHLPGIEKFSSDKIISHADIFPTLFDYLKIKGTGKVMRGSSLLDKNYNRESVLCFHGSLLMADLTFREYSVFFRVKVSGGTISFTPVKCTDRAGNIIKDPGEGAWKDSLKQIIENRK